MTNYETSHPWLTFSINLSRAPAKLWTLLGECNALCSQLSDVAMMPDDRDRLFKESIVRGTIHSFPSGGEHLDAEETFALVDGTLTLPQSRRYLAGESENIIRAFERIRSGLGKSIRTELTPEAIRTYNEMVLDGLVMSPGSFPGDFRKDTPAADGAAVTPVSHNDCPELLGHLCDWLNSATFSPSKDMTAAFGILKAVIGRLYLNWIQPFGTGNNRTMALVDYHLLLASGVPAFACTLPIAHYARTESEYRRRLDAAGKPDGKILPFIGYAVGGFRDGLIELTESIRRMQEIALREHYIHTLFLDKTSPADLRRRDLAFELHRSGKTIPVSAILTELPRLATSYLVRSQKTLVRDIADLLSLGLIEKTSGGIRGKRNILQ